MIRRLANTESIFKLFLLSFFLLLIWTGRHYPEKSRLFPELICRATIILIIISFIQDFIRTKRARMKEEPKETESSYSDIVDEKMKWLKEVEEKSEQDAGFELLEESVQKKRLRQSILIVLVSLGIGYLGGFLLTVPFYFISFGILHGQRKQAIKYIIIALAFTLVVYASFTWLMQVPLLRGIWWDLG
jgi:hypothetical protein